MTSLSLLARILWLLDVQMVLATSPLIIFEPDQASPVGD
jgi:hypothetical protein